MDASLGKTIHPLLDVDVDPFIRSENVTKVVVDDDFVGDDIEMHVFGARHGGVEAKIGKVHDQNFAPGVLMVELMKSFAAVRLAVGVLLLPG